MVKGIFCFKTKEGNSDFMPEYIFEREFQHTLLVNWIKAHFLRFFCSIHSEIARLVCLEVTPEVKKKVEKFIIPSNHSIVSLEVMLLILQS
jgi:hypothetical protein